MMRKKTLGSLSCPITITSQPSSQTDCYNNGVEFTAAFDAGGATVTYQWESSPDGTTWTPISAVWPNISGASGSTSTSPIILTVNNIGVGGANGINTNGLRYRLVITDASGPCTVSTDGLAALTINDITTITPSILTPSITAVEICQGTTITYTVATQGQTPTSIQWRKDLVNLSNVGAYSGVTSNTLTITNPTAAQSGSYSVTVVFPITFPNNNGAGATTCQQTSNLTRNLTVFAACTADAGPDQTVCSSSPNVTLAGVIGGGATSGIWSGGTGTFNPINTALNAVYTPSSAEISAGTVTLTLTTNDPSGPCTPVSDQMTITINNVTAGAVAADQTICSGGDPAAFTETTAATGNGALTYQWQSNTTGCGGTWTNIAGATSATYDAPSGLATTTYYRRVVTSTLGGVPCAANSNCITVTVNNVTPGTVAADQTICSGGDPAAFTQTAAATGAGTLTYQWQSSTTSCAAGFTDIAGATGTTYDIPSGLATTTYYRRVVTSTLGGVPCTANSNCITVTVNNVTAGVVAADQTICSSGDPAAFTVTTAATGTGALTYQWQSNTTGCGGTWANIAGATAATYDIPSGLATTTYYRRVVTSTLNGVPCSANSNCITVTINSVTAGTVAADQTICNGGDPAVFSETTPATGAGSLSYQWQSNATVVVEHGPILLVRLLLLMMHHLDLQQQLTIDVLLLQLRVVCLVLRTVTVLLLQLTM
jgi:hypothetical protein